MCKEGGTLNQRSREKPSFLFFYDRTRDIILICDLEFNLISCGSALRNKFKMGFSKF